MEQQYTSHWKLWLSKKQRNYWKLRWVCTIKDQVLIENMRCCEGYWGKVKQIGGWLSWCCQNVKIVNTLMLKTLNSTTYIPAFLAARTPEGASSKTRVLSASTGASCLKNVA